MKVESELNGAYFPKYHELRFHAEPTDDNESILGEYRTPGRTAWNDFTFRRCDVERPSYELRMPAGVAGADPHSPRSLVFNVPESAQLDRGYVLIALIEVFRTSQWIERSPAGGVRPTAQRF